MKKDERPLALYLNPVEQCRSFAGFPLRIDVFPIGHGLPHTSFHFDG